MSRQYQDPNYLSGSYQTPYPYPNSSQQSGQYAQPPPNTRDPYNDPSRQHALSSSYQEGSLQPQTSRQRRGSHSPYAGTVPFPEPHGSSAGHPQTYYPTSQTTQNMAVVAHQEDRQGSYGYPPSTGTSSDSRRFYSGGGSDAGGGGNFYSNPGVQPPPGGYAATDPQAQNWNATEYDEENDSRIKGPRGTPVGTNRLRQHCRYTGCNNQVFFDRRVNELREWCSDEHMRAAIAYRVEKPCKHCQQWPRRNGYKLCSGNYCRYPGQQY